MSDPDQPLLDRDYPDRQRIVIVPDEVAAAQSEAADAGDGTPDWQRIGESVLTAVTGPITIPALKLAVSVAQSAANARDDGVEILTVTRSDAAGLTLPPGHPRETVVYVGNPVEPPLYYTAAQFHVKTFEHKLSEAVRLLMALGATELEVEHVVGWSSEMSARVQVPIPSHAAEVGADGGRRSASSAALLVRAELDGTTEPSIPDGLVWYPHEPMWREVAKGRMRYGLRNFALGVRYDDDFGVNVGFKLAAAKYGLDLGGEFADHRSTEWRITGTFRTE